MTLKDEFEVFWLNWPRRVAKKQARKAYAAARKNASAHEILEGAERYAKHTQYQESRYILHAATFLNGERWTDEYEPEQPSAIDQFKRGLLADAGIDAMDSWTGRTVEPGNTGKHNLRIVRTN
tara:strand:- start:210 stop:578 length:369 start_codon:yes stop_codon:yes gene_type:complete